MKKNSFIALLLLQSFLVFGQIQTPYSTLHRIPKGWKLPITEGLVAYYPLLRNSRDESGHEQHALPFNATLTADRRGTQNAAYHFAGFNSFISCPLKVNDFQSLTISCWVNWNASHMKGLIFFAGLGSIDGFGLIVGDGLCDIGNRLCLLLGGNPGGACNAWVSPNPIPVNQWTHLTLVKKGDDWRIFMNGNLSGNVTHGYNKPSVTFQIGGAIENKRGSIVGDVSDLVFYNRALSDAEIMTLYNR